MKNITLILLFLSPFYLMAQLSGHITSVTGEPLPFASIYVQGTTNGTTSNENGYYAFDLEPGTYNMVYQYVGYEQKIIEVTYSGQSQVVDIQLNSESVKLNEVVVKANAEDPAYPIIRKAIAKRKYYKTLVNSYQCDVYIKGNQKMLEAPEKIFGQEIGSMGGILDSTGQGIIYLAESQAKLYREQPNKIKEQMFSSKVSGNDNGFGFNRASMMDFSFYDNHVEIERQILSPIANTAMQYYRYKLVGTFFDENGYLINKIEVLKKRESDPVCSGFIYIVEDLWSIHSTELVVTGRAIQQPALDTLVIKQVHVPVQKPDVWMLLSQSLDFKFGAVGFKIDGNFTGVFSNYELNVDFPKGFFNAEVFKVEEGANEKSLVYWDSIRPIPLTNEEGLDYVKKDSLQAIWESKPFLDSMDQVANKFKVWDILLGYDWQNSYERKYFSFASPLTTIMFNPVQGYYGNLNFSFAKSFDEHSMKFIRIKSNLEYGFADNRLRGGASLQYHFNRTHFTQLTLSGGSVAQQINPENPVSPFLNTFTAQFQHKNYIHLYQRNFGAVALRHEIVNGLLFNGKLNYEDRTSLVNNSNYSFFEKDEEYLNNEIIPGRIPDESFNIDQQALVLELNFRIRFGQKYLSYPKRKYILGSKKPDIWVRYKKGIKGLGSDVDFDMIRLNIWDELSFGLVGRSAFNIEVGTFLRKNNLSIIDYRHFLGNQFIINDPSKYLKSFMLLPYYEKSTDQAWMQVHYAHNFDGYILDKLPLFNRLNWKIIAGASFLYTEDQKDYLEINFGFDNIGFGAFRLFRLDGVVSFDNGKYRNWGIQLGVTLP